MNPIKTNPYVAKNQRLIAIMIAFLSAFSLAYCTWAVINSHKLISECTSLTTGTIVSSFDNRYGNIANVSFEVDGIQYSTKGNVRTELSAQDEVPVHYSAVNPQKAYAGNQISLSEPITNGSLGVFGLIVSVLMLGRKRK